MRTHWKLALVLLLASACSTRTSPTDQPSTEPLATEEQEEAPPDSGPALESNPYRVEIGLDESSASTTTIGPEGGVASVTGADGAVYSLTVPEGALLVEEDITLTPVAGIGNFPFGGGVVAAVKMEPEGLYMRKSATLLVEPAQGFEADQLIGFGAQGSGDNFHMRFFEFGEQAFSMEVVHFSTSGAGEGSEEERNRQSGYVPGTYEMAYQQRKAEFYGPIALCQHQGGDCTLSELDDAKIAILEDLLRRWYHQEIVPKFEAAMQDSSQLDCAIVSFLSWLSELQIAPSSFGYDLSFEQIDGWERVETGLDRAFLEARRQCAAGYDPAQAAWMIHWVSWQQVTPMAEPADLFDALKDCLKFELDMQSDFDIRVGEAGEVMKHETKLRNRIPLELDTTQWTSSGEWFLFEPDARETVVYSRISFSGPSSCKLSVKSLDNAELFVMQSGLRSFNVVTRCPAAKAEERRDHGDGPTEPVLMRTALTDTRAEWVLTCGDGEVTLENNTSGWSDDFLTAHFHEFTGDIHPQGAYIYLHVGWKLVLEGDRYAERLYEGPILFDGEDFGTGTEVTVFTLYHTPDEGVLQDGSGE